MPVLIDGKLATDIRSPVALAVSICFERVVCTRRRHANVEYKVIIRFQQFGNGSEDIGIRYLDWMRIGV